MKIYEKHGFEQRFLQGQQVVPKGVGAPMAPDARKTIKIYVIYENLWKSIKSMDSSKYFYKNSRLSLRGVGAPMAPDVRKTIKIHVIYENLGNLWKAWIRAKVSIMAAGCLLPSSNIHDLWKSMKICTNQWNLCKQCIITCENRMLERSAAEAVACKLTSNTTCCERHHI